jgi:type II secretory pathway component PulJ
MQTQAASLRQADGSTLVEVLIGIAVASIVLGGLMVGSISLQRSFSASDRLASTQADLLRVSDYMARDIRNATSVVTSAGSTLLLTVTTGDYYDRRGTPNNRADDVANSPTLGRTGVTYGTNPITIRYVRSGNRILREVSRVDAGTPVTSSTWIADSVENLSVALDAAGIATITSASTMPYAMRKTGSPAPSLSFVTAAQSRNPTP